MYNKNFTQFDKYSDKIFNLYNSKLFIICWLLHLSHLNLPFYRDHICQYAHDPPACREGHPRLLVRRLLHRILGSLLLNKFTVFISKVGSSCFFIFVIFIYIVSPVNSYPVQFSRCFSKSRPVRAFSFLFNIQKDVSSVE